MITMAKISDQLCDIVDELDKTRSLSWSIFMAAGDDGLTEAASNAIQVASQIVNERLDKALQDLKALVAEVDP
jgi:hypothetical protein